MCWLSGNCPSLCVSVLSLYHSFLKHVFVYLWLMIVSEEASVIHIIDSHGTSVCDPHVPCAAWSEPISQSVVECAVMSLLVKAARYAQCMMLVQWLINIMSPHGLHVLTYRVDCITLRPFPLKLDSCIPSHLRISTSSTSSSPQESGPKDTPWHSLGTLY